MKTVGQGITQDTELHDVPAVVGRSPVVQDPYPVKAVGRLLQLSLDLAQSVGQTGHALFQLTAGEVGGLQLLLS